MPIRPELLVRNADGIPQPPQDLLARIQAQSGGRVGLLYTKAAWAITERWPEGDPRYQWVQDGSVQDAYAFDVCGYLPITCSLDDAPAYIERELRHYTTEQFQALRHTVNHWNEVVQDQAVEAEVIGAVTNALDAGNDVRPGISAPVATDVITPIAAPTPTPTPTDKMAAVRAAKAAKKAAAKAAATDGGAG